MNLFTLLEIFAKTTSSANSGLNAGEAFLLLLLMPFPGWFIIGIIITFIAEAVKGSSNKNNSTPKANNQNITKITSDHKTNSSTNHLATKPSVYVKPKYQTSTTRKTTPIYSTRNDGVIRTSSPPINSESYKSVDRSSMFAKREGRLSASSAHYLKKYSVYRAIQMGKMDEIESRSNVFMQKWMDRGIALEKEGVTKFSNRLGLSVSFSDLIISKKHDGACYKPDGIIKDSNGRIKTIIEHKAYGEKHHLSTYERTEEKITYQVQFGMFVTGAKDAYLVLYNPDIYPTSSQLLYKHITIDPKIQKLFEDRFREYENGEKSLTRDSATIYTLKGTAKPVLQCDDDGNVIAEYGSASEAASALGIDAKGIWDTCHGNQKHCAGYVWKYK